MKNLLLAILLAVLGILGVFAYQASRQLSVLQAELTAREEALVRFEAEKAALEEQLAELQVQIDKLGAEADAAAAAAAP